MARLVGTGGCNDMVSDDAMIEIDGVSKLFGQTAAVDALSLRIAPGTKFGFLGPNGAGKTTTIRMLMGLVTPSDGRVRVFGLDPRADSRACRIQIGYVPEEHLAYRWMRVGELIHFCQAFYPTWSASSCQRWLSYFGLRTDQKLKALSKGTLAKLSLLLALSHSPALLIMDEPTSGLDPIVREEFLDGVLDMLCDGEHTVFFSSHILSDVRRLADRVGIMFEGQLLTDRRTDELVASTKGIRAVLQNGSPPQQAPVGTVCQAVDQREWLLTVSQFSERTVQELKRAPEIRSFSVTDLDLEDIFKAYVRGAKEPC